MTEVEIPLFSFQPRLVLFIGILIYVPQLEILTLQVISVVIDVVHINEGFAEDGCPNRCLLLAHIETLATQCFSDMQLS